ncbi:MAG TPA: ABC transporter ATP-binding protein [Flavobacteriales bacterium]|nr:ABC transporter ATP-binding protein [Flavobacteriales bacterium]HMZ49330.1 ABC transporter ATP-binding protein [Flavobacteriales bacterium]HNI03926.1 ABC transporter ATP-binding protein [Flavobacteriales bacterium]HNK41585.1 ABC transporter ATP-binding protein [Flavobacteriales bacterium]HNK84238.1 ABC transporter ATP-binding protein [Flavobacteriales bacterium]
MIRLTGIRKSYRTGSSTLEVLKGIDLHIAKGELVSIMGASGSGKSTLLNIIGILDNYDSGEYRLDSLLIKGQSETENAGLRSKYIGFIFQSFNLISFKNALENVALPLYYQGIPRRKRNEQALAMLESVGLKDWAHHMPNELSGGQKQRVAIARALVSGPKIILADEPTGALDSTTSKEVMELLKHVNRDMGMTVVIVTHERAVAAASQRVIYLRDGMIENDRLDPATLLADVR